MVVFDAPPPGPKMSSWAVIASTSLTHVAPTASEHSALVGPATHGLTGDGSASLVIGAVALRRVGLAAATRLAEGGVAAHDAARADEADGRELSGGLVG